MRHIRTTATAVEKLKLEAKQLSKKTRTPLTTARELVAKKAGYDNWKHVTVCAASTSPGREHRPLLAGIADFLAAELADRPPSDATRQALASGIVFSMDVKDADNAFHDDDVTECEDAMPTAAADLLRDFLVENEDLEANAGEESLQFCLDHLSNYRLFRYSGPRSGPTLDDAFADVLGRYFFHPEHVWLDGRFIAMADVREVRVGGQVVHSTARNASGEVVRQHANPGHRRPGQANGTAASSRSTDHHQEALRASASLRAPERQRLEHIVRELFGRAELRALLTGNTVSLHNSAGGGAFAKLASGDRPQVDATDDLTNHVLPRLVDVLRALGGNGALLDGDIRVDGIEVCLSAVLPPVGIPSSWSVTRRSEVDARARGPVLLDVRL